MYSKLKLLCICFLTCSLCSFAYAAKKKIELKNELQVLIDVSGSMRKNDPHNLRIPAIKLLINLLPEGTKAGIWVFAENTKALVKTGIVNKKWKKNALKKINRIHSRGLLTNIEGAIQNAAKEWFKSTEKQNRHLIILTDGMVDVSKDIMQSAESRARVMSDQIPLLQQAGVKVQTIALSNEADAELLNKLALDTQGWSETALSANQLQKVFFKLFKQALPQDSVPIIGNSFSIDKSIKEFSVLLFKEAGAPEIQLITPDKKIIKNRGKGKKVTWLSDKNYDLITIKEPKSGEWGIVTKMDPENQVMIVTDLKFEVDELPNHILSNENITVSGFFTDQQQLISRKDFLDLIELSVQQLGGLKWKMLAVKEKQGLFSVELGADLKKGRHIFTMVADGKTFKREVSKTIEVIESVIRVKKKVNINARTVTIELIPNELVVNTDMMSVEATVTQLGKDAEKRVIEKSAGQWLLIVEAAKNGGSKMVNFSIMANTVQGESISPDILPVVINEAMFVPLKISVNEVDKTEAVKSEIKTIEKEKDKEDKQEEIAEEPINWVKTSLFVAIANIIFIAAGFFGFKFFKKQAAMKQETLLSRLD